MFKNDYIALVFAHTLRFLGVDSVVISRKAVKKYLYSSKGNSIEMLHAIINSLLLRRVKICMEEVYGIPMGFYKGVLLLYDVKRCIEAKFHLMDMYEECTTDVTNNVISLFLKIYTRIPMILLDAIIWELHHDEEKKKAVKQLAVLISTIRKRLTDLNAIFVSPPTELMNFMKEMNSAIEIDEGSLYKILDPSKTIILDPYASEELSVQDVLENQYFIIGFLVDDKFPRPYATYMLKLLRGIDFKRRSIKLNGSIIGVPKEINKIIDIILDVKLGGLMLEDAIISNMSIDDKIRRIIYDIEKYIAEGKVIDEQYIRRLSEFYNLDRDQFEKIYKRIRKLFSIAGQNIVGQFTS
ncbi:MAG: hypothetical protein QXK24_05415, partial [Ignisphaera sp.]